MTILLKLAWLPILATVQAVSQSSLPVKWEELTSSDFVRAIRNAQGTCTLPFGILEKHGPHLPLGADLINVRYAVGEAAQQEYTVIFPEYYFGQIFEAKHQPGTIAYSLSLQLTLLQETTDEMARNGCRKIIIVNGHGGNEHLLPLFAQSQLASPHDYVVYVFQLPGESAGRPAVKSPFDLHAGESETSRTMISRPDLVHLERVPQESGQDQARISLPRGIYTGIWWYARFPNHYAGDASLASRALGEFDTNALITKIVAGIRAVKADEEAPRLQKEFYQRSQEPLKAK